MVWTSHLRRFIDFGSPDQTKFYATASCLHAYEVLMKLRGGTAAFQIEVGRWQGVMRNDRVCKECQSVWGSHGCLLLAVMAGIACALPGTTSGSPWLHNVIMR